MLSLLGITLWKRTGMLFDITCEHKQYCRRFAHAERLLDAGIKLFANNSKLLLDKAMEKSFPIHYNVSCPELSCSGTITMARQKVAQMPTDKFIIKAQLKEETKQTFRLSCYVQKRTNDQNKPYVDVSCFTIG
jgi:hypothetical protein